MKTIQNGTLNEYKNAIKQFGKEIDSLITYTIEGVTTTLDTNDIYSVAPHYEGDFLKSVMKQLDLTCKNPIPIGTEINYKFGVKARYDDVLDYKDNYDYIDFGNYIVYSSEKNVDTDNYTLICYDKMLYAMRDYETPKLNGTTITYPISTKNYLQAICDTLGLTFKNASDTFPNDSGTIPKEMYLDEDGKSLNYLFRDVLSDLAELTASTICIDANDNLELRYLDGDTSPYYQYKTFNGNIRGKSAITLQDTTRANSIRNFELRFVPLTTLDSPFNIFSSSNFSIIYQSNRFIVKIDNIPSYLNIQLPLNQVCTIEVNRINNTNVIYINGNSVTSISDRVLSNITLFGNTNTEVAITNVNVGGVYELAYDVDTKQIGLIRNVPLAVANGYTTTTTIPDPPTYDTIDEEYINEDSAIFGETYGPINTITLQRTADDYAISISAPSDLPDDEKNEILIIDDTKQQSDLKENMMNGILNKLYGITYTKNDFKSTGLGYYDLLDKYNVSIQGNTYPCIMLNDDFQVEGGLEEYISAGNIENSVETYNTSTQDARINDRNTFRIDKLEEQANNVYKRHLYGFLSSDVTISPGVYTEIDTLSQYFNTTSNLSISNGKIVVGSGVSLIKVSFNIGVNIASQDTLYSYLTKNGSNTGLWIVQNIGTYDCFHREDLIDVEDGDVISCNVYLANGGYVNGGARSNFTAEIIK